MRQMPKTGRRRMDGRSRSGQMKTLTEYLTFHTTAKREYINITSRVAEAVGRSGVREGMVLVSAKQI